MAYKHSWQCIFTVSSSNLSAQFNSLFNFPLLGEPPTPPQINVAVIVVPIVVILVVLAVIIIAVVLVVWGWRRNRFKKKLVSTVPLPQ